MKTCGGIFFLLTAAALGLSGCQSTKTASPADARKIDDLNFQNVETSDLNRDERIDGWSYYGVENGERKLLKRRTDLNFDGKVDVTQYLQNGLVTLEEIDLDFDGKPDLRTTYENGVPQKSELDFDFDGRPELWRFYKDGVLVRKERDTNRDGKIDVWEYFEAGKVSRVGKDSDGDGKVDIWE